MTDLGPMCPCCVNATGAHESYLGTGGFHWGGQTCADHHLNDHTCERAVAAERARIRAAVESFVARVESYGVGDFGVTLPSSEECAAVLRAIDGETT
jgi:hypothetical protein